MVSDKGYGYLSIVNGYSIKLTGGQRFPLDFEAPQGRETKLQTPTFTLLKRKTKHKRERCDLAACDGWSEAGQGRGYGEFWVALGVHMLCGPSSNKALDVPLPSQCHALKADPDLAASSSELEKSSLQLWM